MLFCKDIVCRMAEALRADKYRDAAISGNGRQKGGGSERKAAQAPG